MTKTSTVRVLSLLAPGQVALWERSDDHPGGEVFISSTTPVLVALTPAVRDAISRGRLVLVPPEAVTDEPTTGDTPPPAPAKRKRAGDETQ